MEKYYLMINTSLFPNTAQQFQISKTPLGYIAFPSSENGAAGKFQAPYQSHCMIITSVDQPYYTSETMVEIAAGLESSIPSFKIRHILLFVFF